MMGHGVFYDEGWRYSMKGDGVLGFAMGGQYFIVRGIIDKPWN